MYHTYTYSEWIFGVWLYWNLYEISKVVSKVDNLSREWPKCSLFNIYNIKVYVKDATPFPGLLHFTLDTHLIMLSIKQGGIKDHLVWLYQGLNLGLLGFWWTL